MRRDSRRKTKRQPRPILFRPQIAPQPQFVLHTIFLPEVISTVRPKKVKPATMYRPVAPSPPPPPPRRAPILIAPRIVRARDGGMRVQWAPFFPQEPTVTAHLMVAPRIVRRRDGGMRVQWAPMNPFEVPAPVPTVRAHMIVAPRIVRTRSIGVHASLARGTGVKAAVFRKLITVIQFLRSDESRG